MGRVANRGQRIVIRWQARSQSEALSPALDRAYAIEEKPCFDEALKAIDEAERQVWQDSDTPGKSQTD